MRRPSFTTRRSPVDLQLTPMIDCVFLLMIYFIFSSNFNIAEQLLPSQLSAAAGSGAASMDTPPPRMPTLKTWWSGSYGKARLPLGPSTIPPFLPWQLSSRPSPS